MGCRLEVAGELRSCDERDSCEGTMDVGVLDFVERGFDEKRD